MKWKFLGIRPKDMHKKISLYVYIYIHIQIRTHTNTYTEAIGVSRRHLTAESRVCSRGILCGISGGQSGTGNVFSLSTSLLPCHRHSTPHSIQLPSTLYKLILAINSTFEKKNNLHRTHCQPVSHSSIQNVTRKGM